MTALARHANPVSLADGLALLDAGTIPPRTFTVTFDDGYADNATLAAPILAECGVPATFFVATGFLDGGRMWNDTVIEAVRRLPDGVHDFSDFGLGPRSCVGDASRLTLSRDIVKAIKHRSQRERAELAGRLGYGLALPDDLMMSTAQVRCLADAGFEVGGHTVTHPILSRLPPSEARSEIEAGRRRLQDITGRPVRYFAYPNGQPGEDYGHEHAQMAREIGFEAAVSTRRGLASVASDRWQLPRFAPWGEPAHKFLARRLLEFRASD